MAQSRRITHPALLSFIAEKLSDIGFTLEGQQANEARVASLFSYGPAVTAGATTPPASPPPPPLSPLFCEEHLASALALTRQAIQEREMFWTAGEKFATLALSLTADHGAEALLALEAEAVLSRRSAAVVARDGEAATNVATLSQRDASVSAADNLQPDGMWAKWDANREYIQHLLGLGPGGQVDHWDQAAQSEHPAFLRPQPTDPDAMELLVDGSMMKRHVALALAQRATKARFRVAHDGASIAAATGVVSHIASSARLATLNEVAEFEAKATSIANDRSDLAKRLVAQKELLASDVSLLGFKQQMDRHGQRGSDLYAEALERAGAAHTGVGQVYGNVVSAVPSGSLDDAEALLQWCREAGRKLLGYEPRAAAQRVTVSVSELLDAGWRTEVASGASLDARWLATLGCVVRLRNVSIRYVGAARSSFPVSLTSPGASPANPLTDSDLEDVVRTDTGAQKEIPLRLIAVPAVDATGANLRSAHRAVHNVCPSGIWTLMTHADLSAVDDILLDFDISFFLRSREAE